MTPPAPLALLQRLSRYLRSLWRRATDGRAVALPDLFARFQDVLEAKNRALEIITDMGEKLGGDYLFDINYTQGAYASLVEAMEESISAFSRLTGNRYPELAEILARIDGLVRRMLTSEGPGSDKLVLFHDDITWDLAGEVGGKNYQLAVLHNELKLRVPPAFAISTAAFDEYLHHNGLAGRLAGMGDEEAGGEAALAALRRDVLAGSLPPDFAKALAAAVRKMRSRCGRHCRLAVRSSADEEDGFFSFAGQFESILNVDCTEAAVAAAYRRVVASLFQPDAVAYQRHSGYELGRVKMAVACVAMVEAEVSGVVYTAAAANDRDTLLISAAWGLGPGVVDGLTDADLYTVRKGLKPQLINVRVGRKELMVVRGEDEEGTATVATPEELRSKSCLSESQVLELASRAMAVEAFYKSPQDIEWAIDGQGRCYFLQTRGLRLGEETDAAAPPAAPRLTEDLPVLMRNRGTVVQPGATAGRVFILQHADDLDQVPRGSILVARHDSAPFRQGYALCQRNHYRPRHADQPYGLDLPGIRHPHRGEYRRCHHRVDRRPGSNAGGRQRRRLHGAARGGARTAAAATAGIGQYAGSVRVPAAKVYHALYRSSQPGESAGGGVYGQAVPDLQRSDSFYARDVGPGPGGRGYPAR